MQNLYIDYMKADQVQDKESKERIRSLMNALTFEPETMTIWWRTATDEWREMILENWDLLSKTQQEALRKYWETTGQVPDVTISPASIFEQKFGEDIPNTFWETWIEKMTLATDKFRERFLGAMGESTIKGAGGQPLSAEQQQKESDRLVDIVNKQVEEYERLVQEGHLPPGIAGKEEWTKPTVTEITINISRIDAKGVTAKEVEEAIPGALAKAIEKEEIIKKIRKKV